MRRTLERYEVIGDNGNAFFLREGKQTVLQPLVGDVVGELGNWKYNILLRVLRFFLGLLPKETGIRVASWLVEDLVPQRTHEGPYGPIKFSCPGRWPLRRSHMKEGWEGIPLWIDRLPPDAVLWDIGANVGAYALLAASRNLRVVAFEPEAGTFAVLQLNLDLNDWNDRVTALNMALSDKTGLAAFELEEKSVGSAEHQVVQQGQGRAIMVFAGRDLLTLGLPRPNYIKIDVDGTELSVL